MKTEKRTYRSYDDVKYAAGVLKQGGLVVFPTETVYGLGALLSCPDAVQRIYEIKGRDKKKPLSILLADAGQIREVADIPPAEEPGEGEELPGGGRTGAGTQGGQNNKNTAAGETCEERLPEPCISREKVMALAEAFWPGPLTMILPKKDVVPDLVTAGKDTVGVRIPDHEFALALLAEAGGPVVTTSANLSGQQAAVSAEEAEAALSGKVDLIIDGGACRVKLASTVAGFQNGEVLIFREGKIGKQDLLNVMEADGGKQ